jgi:hypothetical protein
VSSPLQIAVYISGHGYGHFTRTLNLLSLFSHNSKYKFHIRTSSSLFETPLAYALHPSVIQTNPYQLDGAQSLESLQTFDPSLAQAEEVQFLKQYSICAILSDAPSLPCLLGHSLNIPSILVTNFTFDSIYQALLDNSPECDTEYKTALQVKIDEMSRQYGLAHTVIRLPGYIPFHFSTPRIIDAPMHFRKAVRSRNEVLADLGLQCLEEKKILLHCFGGHGLDAPSQVPTLPEGWACVSQTIDCPPFFYKIANHVYMPDLVGACDVVLGKLGWGTCSEVIGNGYKPFIYVPRSAFVEEAGLLNWMESAHRKIVRLTVEKYESEDWQGAIEAAAQMMNLDDFKSEADWSQNDTALVRIVEDTLESALNEIS